MLSEYRKLVCADDRYNDNILSFTYLCRSFLRLLCEKSVKSMCYLKIYVKVYLMHKTNHAELVNRQRMDRNKIWSGDKIQNGEITNFVGWRHKSRDSASCNWNTWRYWLLCCYYRHGRRVNSLCQITERLLFFRISSEPSKHLLDHHIFSHTHH